MLSFKLNKCRAVQFIIVSIIAVCLLWLNVCYQFLTVNLGTVESGNSPSFTILTYNVNASDSSSFNRHYQQKLIELIKREKPYIVCFQELSFENLSKIKPQLDSIYGPCDTLKGDDQMWRLMFYSAFPLRNYKRYHCEGYIDTTDFDSVEKKEYEQIKLQMPMMSADLEVSKNKWIRIFSCHLRSSAYSTARRSMDKDDSWFSGIPLYFRNYDIGKRIRDYEARNVRKFVDDARVEGIPVIVIGDLNDWSGSDCLDMLQGTDESRLKNAWWEAGNGFGFTYCGWHLRLRLDHILYSKEFQLQKVRVLDSDLSDHKPLMADFQIK